MIFLPNRAYPIKVIYDMLVREEGDKCKTCGRSPPIWTLVVDHIDNNENNWTRANLQLLCRKCNRAKNPPRAKGSVSKSKSVCVSDQNAQEEGNIDREPPELRVKRDKTPQFDNWIYDNIGRNGGLTFWEAEYEGSGFIGLSPVTAKRRIYQLLGMHIIQFGEGPRGHRKIIWGMTDQEKQAEIMREAKREVERVLGKGRS